VQKIRIEVYDITGCVVLTVLDEIEKPGTYTLTIDGSFLNRGLYCCRLSNGTYSCAKLMLLVR